MKSSSSITTLNINPSVSIHNLGGTDVGSYVGFALQNISNVNIKDLNIVVLNSGTSNQTNSRGESIYGVHIDNVGAYTFNRLNISTGNASNGANGIDGENGEAGQKGEDGKSVTEEDYKIMEDFIIEKVEENQSKAAGRVVAARARNSRIVDQYFNRPVLISGSTDHSTKLCNIGHVTMLIAYLPTCA